MATQTLRGFMKSPKGFDDISGDLKELGLPDNLPDDSINKIKALLLAKKEYSQKFGATAGKTSPTAVSMTTEAEIEKMRQVEEKKFAEMQARYLDQIKVLEGKLKKRSEELTSFEMQVKLLQEANKVIQNEFAERERALAKRESELNEATLEYKEKIRGLEESLLNEQKDRVRENELKELMKQQQAEFEQKEEEMIEKHRKEIDEINENFENERAKLEEIKRIELETMKEEFEKRIEDLNEDHEKVVKEIEQKNLGEIKKINDEHHKKLVEKGREFDSKVQELQEDLICAERLAVQAKIDYATASIDNDVHRLEIKKLRSAVNVLPGNMKVMLKRASSGLY